MNGPGFKMADVAAKPITRRKALAAGRILVGKQAFERLEAGDLPKGDALTLAEFAGLQGAKQTPSLLPLCHPIALNRVMVQTQLSREHQAVDVYCLAEIAERTGVEMEALTGVSVALLTIWDLVKPLNAALEISGTRLLYKSGGKSGVWEHPEGLPPEARKMLDDAG
jgi:molybdenum cofactor biosynthesis protein MoaC